MDVVLDFQEVSCSCICLGNGLVPDVFGVLDEIRSIVQISLSIQVEISYMIPQICHEITTGGVTFRIRRSHICWEISEDVSESHLVIVHLILEHCRVEGCQILVAPGVGCDLMTFCNHTFDSSSVLCSGINCAFSKIVTGNHEGSLSSISCKFVQEIISVKIRSIIEGKRDIYQST